MDDTVLLVENKSFVPLVSRDMMINISVRQRRLSILAGILTSRYFESDSKGLTVQQVNLNVCSFFLL